MDPVAEPAPRPERPLRMPGLVLALWCGWCASAAWAAGGAPVQTVPVVTDTPEHVVVIRAPRATPRELPRISNEQPVAPTGTAMASAWELPQLHKGMWRLAQIEGPAPPGAERAEIEEDTGEERCADITAELREWLVFHQQHGCRASAVQTGAARHVLEFAQCPGQPAVTARLTVSSAHSGRFVQEVSTGEGVTSVVGIRSGTCDVIGDRRRRARP